LLRFYRAGARNTGLEHWWNVIDEESVSIRRETCPGDTFSTTNPTCTDIKLRVITYNLCKELHLKKVECITTLQGVKLMCILESG